MVSTLRWLALFLVTEVATAQSNLNMTKGVTPVSREIYDLHMFVIYICCGIAAVVFGVLTYTLIRHRKSRGVKPATFTENTTLEVIWTIIPVTLIAIIAVPSIRVLIDLDDFDAAELTVKVTGHQWNWQYEYLEHNVGFFSNLATPMAEVMGVEDKGDWYLLEVDEPLVLPTGRKIRFVVTSNDVIHSWWVPALGVKRDAVPGYVYEAWARIDEPGTYRGQCAELCGVNHGYMPIVVEAVSPDDFDGWIEARANAPVEEPSDEGWTLPMAMEKGAPLYDQYCGACHKFDGTGNPPLYPALKNSSVATSSDVNEHIELVLDGVPNTAMQAYAPQLDNEELAAILTYERNAWSHNTGDLVLPSQVQALRK